MKVWVDLSDLLNWPHRHLTGIQRVVAEVSTELQRIERETAYFNYDPETRKFFVVDPTTILHLKTCEFAQVRTLDQEATFADGDEIYLIGGSWVFPNLLSDLTKLKRDASFRVVQFIHDVTPIQVPQVHRDKSREIMEKWLAELQLIADAYLTNSEFSKAEIQTVFANLGYPEAKFKVVRLGDQLPAGIAPSKHERFEVLDQEFILCVGSFEPRKNHLLLYQAWHLLIEKYGDQSPQLVIVGRAGWQSEDFKALLFRDPLLKNKLVWLQQVSESELKWLYGNCLFTVYPSFYEGWGLPVAEGLNYGKFCIASSAASIPEIAGSLIDYFNPYDSRECFQKIERCFFDRAYFRLREGQVKANFKTTPWVETARQCLEIEFKDES